MPHPKSVFVCQQCGNESPQWVGHCPACDQWNTYVEIAAKRTPAATSPAQAQELSRLAANSVPRIALPLAEFNREVPILMISEQMEAQATLGQLLPDPFG